MNTATLHTLISLRHRIAHLKALASTSLSAAEQHAVQDSLAQTYDRAAFLLAQAGDERVKGGDEERCAPVKLTPLVDCVCAAPAKNRTRFQR
jgi:hypothetical protein